MRKDPDELLTRAVSELEKRFNSFDEAGANEATQNDQVYVDQLFHCLRVLNMMQRFT